MKLHRNDRVGNRSYAMESMICGHGAVLYGKKRVAKTNRKNEGVRASGQFLNFSLREAHGICNLQNDHFGE